MGRSPQLGKLTLIEITPQLASNMKKWETVCFWCENEITSSTCVRWRRGPHATRYGHDICVKISGYACDRETLYAQENK